MTGGHSTQGVILHSDTSVTVKSVRQRICSGRTDNASRFGPGGQITLADLVLPPQIWSG